MGKVLNFDFTKKIESLYAEIFAIVNSNPEGLTLAQDYTVQKLEERIDRLQKFQYVNNKLFEEEI